MRGKKVALSRDHEKWAFLVSDEHRLADGEFRAEALAYSRQFMKRVRIEILKLIEDLSSQGYQFSEDCTPYKEPMPGTASALEEFWKQGVYVPISLQGWMLEIGEVNLCGHNPAWPKPTYAFPGVDVSEVICTDPLVVEISPDYIQYAIDEHSSAESDPESEPLRLEIAPDYLHKANISGGPPYSVFADHPRVEALLLDERHCTSFTEYVRRATSWRGFPGMDYVQPGLLPITHDDYPLV